MRCYCTECKRELIVTSEIMDDVDGVYCPVCEEGEYDAMTIIPDFETPTQYKNRTSKEWNGAVWWKSERTGHWYLCEYSWIKAEAKLGRVRLCVLANLSEPPSDDWRPS